MKYIIILLTVISTEFCNAQNTSSKAPYGLLEMIHSKSMNKKLPALVFLPKSYKKSKDSFPVVYLLHGVLGDILDAPLLEKKLREVYNPKLRAQEVADFYNIIIVAPLVNDSYYLDSPLKSEIRFSTYIGEELPAFIDSKYNTISNREGRFLAGFSMGGYGAVSLLCKYPDNFSVALSRSGILNLATGVEDLNWDNPSKKINLLLGDYWANKKNWHQNSCFNLINRIRDRNDIAIVIEVGVEDFLYKTNRLFKTQLDELDVPNIYSEYQGGHKWSDNALNSLLSQLQFFHKTIIVH